MRTREAFRKFEISTQWICNLFAKLSPSFALSRNKLSSRIIYAVICNAWQVIPKYLIKLADNDSRSREISLVARNTEIIVKLVYSSTCPTVRPFNPSFNLPSTVLDPRASLGEKGKVRIGARTDYRWQVPTTCNRELSERAITSKSIAPRAPRWPSVWFPSRNTVCLCSRWNASRWRVAGSTYRLSWTARDGCSRRRWFSSEAPRSGRWSPTDRRWKLSPSSRSRNLGEVEINPRNSNFNGVHVDLKYLSGILWMLRRAIDLPLTGNRRDP